jgi:hypothetical protein
MTKVALEYGHISAGIGMATAKVVENLKLVFGPASVLQRKQHVRANVACTTNNKYSGCRKAGGRVSVHTRYGNCSQTFPDS